MTVIAHWYIMAIELDFNMKMVVNGQVSCHEIFGPAQYFVRPD